MTGTYLFYLLSLPVCEPMIIEQIDVTEKAKSIGLMCY